MTRPAARGVARPVTHHDIDEGGVEQALDAQAGAA